MKEKDEEEKIQVERQTERRRTDDSNLKKTRIEIPGLY
jgi:hypothetical protein